MSAYLVFNYPITDADGYGAYPPAAFEPDAYNEVKHLRTDNGMGITVLCDDFTPSR